MKKHIIFLLLLTSFIGFSQEYDDDVDDDVQVIEVNSIVHNKNTKIEEAVTFKSDLKDKYNDKEFKYIDDLKEPKKEEVITPTSNNNFGFLSAFGSFMSYFFPFLLAIIIVLIILKTFVGTDAGFWNFKNSSKKVADKLVYEDEDIHETDFKRLLEKAIQEKNFRLATRYYYLSLLKKLSDKKSIEYHKDKTNTEYVFEIENKEIRSQFSEVSYIYSYVWYGEFPIDSNTFKTVEKKYKFLFNSIN